MNDTNHILDQVTLYLNHGGLFNPELMDHQKVRNLIITLRDRMVSAQHANERDRVRLVVHLDELRKAMQSWKWIPDGETQNAEAEGTLSKEVDCAYRAIKTAMDPLWAMARDLTDSPGSAGRGAGVRDGERQARGDQAVALLRIVRESIMSEVLEQIRDRGWPLGERIDYILREVMRP